MKNLTRRIVAMLLVVCTMSAFFVPTASGTAIPETDGSYVYDFSAAASLGWKDGSTDMDYTTRPIPDSNAAAMATWNDYYADGTLNWSYEHILKSTGVSSTANKITTKKATGDALQFSTVSSSYTTPVVLYKNSSSTEVGWCALKIKAPALGKYNVTFTHGGSRSNGAASGNVYLIPAIEYTTASELNTAINNAVANNTGKLENSVCYNASNGVNKVTELGSFTVSDASVQEYLAIFSIDDNKRAYLRKLTFTPVTEDTADSETYTFTTAATTIDTMEADYSISNNWKVVAKDSTVTKYEMNNSRFYIGFNMGNQGKWVAFQLQSPGTGTYEMLLNTKSPDGTKTGASMDAYLLNADDAQGITDYETLLTSENYLGYCGFGADGLSGNFGTYKFTEGEEYILVLRGNQNIDSTVQADNFYLNSLVLNQVRASVGEVNYASVAEAVAAAGAGDTLTLQEDALGDIDLPAGVSLDLNGNTWTAAEYIATNANEYIYDSVGTGVLKIGSMSLYGDNNDYLPLYDATAGGYGFYKYNLLVPANDNESIGDARRFWFYLNFVDSAAYDLVAAGTSKMTLGVDITWGTDSGIDATFDSGSGAEAFAAAWAAQAKNNNKVWLYVNLKGIDEEYPYVLNIIPTIQIGDHPTELTNGQQSFDPTGNGAAAPDTVNLDGKKIIFIGNSHTYYGKTVLEKTQSVQSQEARSNDQGFFYQLCKANGMEPQVTNWTYGGHSLSHLFEECTANRGCDGVDHKADITDKYFDYVVFQPGTSNVTSEEFMRRCNVVMDFFKEANPDVQFVFLMPRQIYLYQYEWMDQLKVLEENGVIIVDWGKVVYDVINGDVTVPGATKTYNKHSFIIQQSADDGYHVNMLSGYITTLMTYSAITGKSAVGQTYAFCNDPTINKAFDFDAFIEKYYTYGGATTNFPEIFASASDMRGIQLLIDQYLADKAYLEY